MKKFQWLKITSIAILIATGASPVYAAESKAPTHILIKNVHIWDGSSDVVTKKISVLVEGDPLDDVAVLTAYHTNIKIVIKDGKIFKHTL
jgi:hypothetical protein